jgi:hypothetical protein
MRALAIAALLMLAAPPALAAGGGKKAEAPSEGHVDIYPLGAPVIVKGRVVNYVFVSVRLVTPSGTDPQPLKAHEPRIREALVRAAHRTPFNSPDDRSQVDEAVVARTALAEGRRIAGAKAFVRAEVLRQTPQRRLANASATR